MRIRSVVTVLAMLGLLAGAILRCSLPPVPPPPQLLATKTRFVGGAVVSVVDDGRTPIDRAALVASLKEMGVAVVFISSSANPRREFVDETVALAVELQRELDGDIFIGTYDSAEHNGTPIDALLQKDEKLTVCYPDGPRLEPAATIDKIRLCSQDVSTKIVQALAKTNASSRIGCMVSHRPELVDTLPEEGRAKLDAFFRDSAASCTDAKRRVAVSPLVTSHSGDPTRAGTLLRESLGDASVDFVVVEDGIGAGDHPEAGVARRYFFGVQLALVDRDPTRTVLANVDAFECDTPSCARARPTSPARFIEQLCAARGLVGGILATEYVHDLAGRPLVTAVPVDGGDASAEVQSILDDVDASAQLRKGYLEWRDDGGSCAK